MPSRFGRVWILTLSVMAGGALVGFGVLLLATEPPPGTGIAAPADAPNVVLIVMDAFRADRVGAHRNGVPLTPFLDSLAREGAVFPNAITNCTWTRPAMASLFTSMYVDAHRVTYATVVEGMPDAFNALPPGMPTMATVLQKAGYHTIGIQTNGNLVPELGFSAGFDVYRTSEAVAGTGTAVTDWAVEEVDRAQMPFFLYAHYMDTHLPYAPPARYRDLVGYSTETISEEERVVVEDFRDYYMEHCRFVTGQRAEFPFEPLSDAAKEAVKTLYDALIRYTDDEVHRLVEAVRARAPETIFIITADHGEHFWDHGLLGHGLTLRNCELRIPLYMFGGPVRPATGEAMVETVDILPTLAGLLAIPALENWQGRDVFRSTGRAVYARTRSSSPDWNTDFEMVVAGDYKLILDRRDGSAQLFSWSGDADEQRDLAESHPERVERLKQMLQQHRQDNLRARRWAGKQQELDEETLARLRALGYLTGKSARGEVPGQADDGRETQQQGKDQPPAKE